LFAHSSTPCSPASPGDDGILPRAGGCSGLVTVLFVIVIVFVFVFSLAFILMTMQLLAMGSVDAHVSTG
jgi:hypothetical protein